MKKLSIFALFLLLVLPLACQKETILEENTDNNELTIQEAKAWFEEVQNTPSNARVAGEPDIFSKVFWNYSFNHKPSKESSDLIVTPIYHKKKDDYAGYKQLWVYKNKNKKMTMRVVEYVFAQKNGKTDSENSLKNFSGLMIFRDWQNNFIGGFSYKNNKIIGATTQLGYFKNTPPAGARPNGRTAGSICGFGETCYYTYAYVPALPEIGGYWSMVCEGSSYSCYFNDITEEYIGPMLPAYGSPDYGSGGGIGGGPIIIGNAYKYEIITTGRCDAFNRMYQIHSSDPAKYEVGAYIAKDGRIIILPTDKNDYWYSKWFGDFRDMKGNLILAAGPTSANPYIILFDHSNVSATNPKPKEILVEVVGMIHTHPCTKLDGSPKPVDEYDFPSPAYPNGDGDVAVAKLFPNFVHYIVNCNNIIQFDASYNPTLKNLISKTPRSQCR